MELRKLNLLNFFEKNEINEKKIALMMPTLFPALFVTKTFEGAFIYLIYFLIYLVLTTLTAKIIDKLVPNEMRKLIMIFSFFAISVIVAQFIDAFNIAFSNNYLTYIYLFPISALPYLLASDNKDVCVGKSLVNSLKSYLGVVAFILPIALVREILGTGMMIFGDYTFINFQVKLFPNFALRVLNNPFGAIILLGFSFAIFQAIVKKEKKA